MNPTPKHPALDLLLGGLARKSRTETIRKGLCMTCDAEMFGNIHYAFRDDISRKEYAISGMCQMCQDSVFGVGEPDDGQPQV